MIECPNCHKMITGDKSMCPRCGELIKKANENVFNALSECPNCHKLLNMDIGVCSRCGFVLSQTGAESETPEKTRDLNETFSVASEEIALSEAEHITAPPSAVIEKTVDGEMIDATAAVGLLKNEKDFSAITDCDEKKQPSALKTVKESSDTEKVSPIMTQSVGQGEEKNGFIAVGAAEKLTNNEIARKPESQIIGEYQADIYRSSGETPINQQNRNIVIAAAVRGNQPIDKQTALNTKTDSVPAISGDVSVRSLAGDIFILLRKKEQLLRKVLAVILGLFFTASVAGIFVTGYFLADEISYFNSFTYTTLDVFIVCIVCIIVFTALTVYFLCALTTLVKDSRLGISVINRQLPFRILFWILVLGLIAALIGFFFLVYLGLRFETVYFTAAVGEAILLIAIALSIPKVRRKIATVCPQTGTSRKN